MLARADVETCLQKLGHAIRSSLERCVEACFDCAKVCVDRAGEEGVAAFTAALMTKCTQACLDCALACAAACSRTAAAIDPLAVRQALENCVAACRACLPHLPGEGALRCRRCADRCGEALLRLA